MQAKGVDARDCLLIKAIISTPVGSTREITIYNSLKQGPLTGPEVCKVSMDHINNSGLKNPMCLIYWQWHSRIDVEMLKVQNVQITQ